MKLIVAVDMNWGIGKGGDLLIKIPEDMKRFRECTERKVIVMGRRTLESFPDGKPLKNRLNVVMTREPEGITPIADNLVVVSSMHELIYYLNTLDDSYRSDDIYIIGGGQIYHQMVDYCDKAIVTKIGQEFDSDTFCPNLDKLTNWRLVDESPVNYYNGIPYKFCEYQNIL